MRIAILVATAAMLAGCFAPTVEMADEPEFVYTGPIPVVEGGYRHKH